jgi:hypothetical protein
MSIPPASPSSPIDYSLVREYLSLPTTTQLVQTAATLAQSSEVTEQDLISNALRLHTSVENTLLDKRVDLLSRMDDTTRTALASFLGIDRFENSSYPEIQMKDAGLAYFLHVVHPAHVIISRHHVQHLNEGKAEAAFDELDLSVPSRPWSLDSILRTVANADDAPILQQAFKDYWGVAHRADEDHSLLQRKRDSLAHYKKEAEDPTLGPYREAVLTYIGDLQRDIEKLETKHLKRASFYPGHDLDPVFDQDLKEFVPFKDYSNDLRPDQVVAILTSNFQKFWNTYGDAYQELSQQRSQTSKQLSRSRREAGARGVAVRESKKWGKALDDFIGECHVDKSWKNRPDNNDAVQEFAERRRGSRPGATTLAHFIGTILTAAITKQKPADTLGILQKSGVSGQTAIQVDFVASCIERMEMALKKPRKSS